MSHHVEHHSAESDRILPMLIDQGRTFDLAMVDGNHRLEAVLIDLVHLARLVRRGGVIFLDDCQLPGVAKTVAFFVTDLGWALEEISPDDGVHQWAVVRTSTAPDARPFDYFVDL